MYRFCWDNNRYINKQYTSTEVRGEATRVGQPKRSVHPDRRLIST